jgi:hypothetical protein
MDDIVIRPVPSEQRASACLVGIIGGLLIVRAATQSLTKASFIVLLTCAVAGLILGGRKPRILSSIVGSSLLVAVMFSLTSVIHFVIRVSVGALWHLPGPSSLIPPGISQSKDPRAFLFFLAVVLLVVLLSAFILTLVSSIASRALLSAAVQLFAAGPEAIERTNKIIVGLTATVGALFALWLAFG